MPSVRLFASSSLSSFSLVDSFTRPFLGLIRKRMRWHLNRHFRVSRHKVCQNDEHGNAFNKVDTSFISQLNQCLSINETQLVAQHAPPLPCQVACLGWVLVCLLCRWPRDHPRAASGADDLGSEGWDGRHHLSCPFCLDHHRRCHLCRERIASLDCSKSRTLAGRAGRSMGWSSWRQVVEPWA